MRRGGGTGSGWWGVVGLGVAGAGKFGGDNPGVGILGLALVVIGSGGDDVGVNGRLVV